jgi:hypothetical protein
MAELDIFFITFFVLYLKIKFTHFTIILGRPLLYFERKKLLDCQLSTDVKLLMFLNVAILIT